MTDDFLHESDSAAKAWEMVSQYAKLAARQASSAAADGDAAAGQRAAETLMFTQRLAAAAAGYGAGWSPERILAEVAATMERMQGREVERHKAMMAEMRNALVVTWEQSEKLKDGVAKALEHLGTVAEFTAKLGRK